MAHHALYLKSLYASENPLRRLGAMAAKIEKAEKVRVIRCNVGDPTGPTLEASNLLMAAYYLAREEGTGYTDHAGEPVLKQLAAEMLMRIDRLPAGTFDADKVFCVAGGTGGLNIALSIFEEGKTQVLVTEPYYPPWDPISQRNNLIMTPFPLRAEDNYLLNIEILREKLRSCDPKLPAVLMYHYPHNPTGKTLSEEEAQKLGAILNQLIDEFPNLYLVQEDLYLATVRSDLGIHTPMRYFSAEARERTILVHSPSKEGHGQDRGALVATPSSAIAERCRGSTSFANLGTSTGAFLGTVRTLYDIAEGIDPAGGNRRNHRYVTADYYQERLVPVGRALMAIGERAGETILDLGVPEGTYYLWPRLRFLAGRRVPSDLQDNDISMGEFSGNSNYPEEIKSSHDIMHIMARAHRIGFVPFMGTPGEFFLKDNGDLRMRFATVERDPSVMNEVANTLLGVSGTLMGWNLDKLGVRRRTLSQLQAEFPPLQVQDSFMAKFLGDFPSHPTFRGRGGILPEPPR